MEKRKLTKRFIRILLFVLAYGFIICKLTNNNLIKELFSVNSFFQISSFYAILPIIALMLVNWLTEALKWKYLVSEFKNYSLLEALKIVFIGVGIGQFTPNRTGEVPARILFIPRKEMKNGIAATLCGSAMQLLSTVLFGFFGIIWHWKLLINQYPKILLFSSSLFLFTTLFFIFSKNLKLKILKSSFRNKLNGVFSSFKSISGTKGIQAFLLSIFRYLVFATQFYLLLQVFNVEISYSNALAALGLMYFTNTLIPSFILTEPGVRGSTAILFLGIYSANTNGIIYTSTLIWLINIIIPALIGLILFYFSKLNKETKSISDIKEYRIKV